jgi:hypothetical protein
VPIGIMPIIGMLIPGIIGIGIDMGICICAAAFMDGAPWGMGQL